MIVVFTGPTGVRKDDVKERLALRHLEARGLPAGERQRYFTDVSLEHEIRGVMGQDHIRVFLEDRRTSKQEEVVDRAWQRILAQACEARGKDRDVLVDLHLVYFRGPDRLSLWTFEHFRQLRPDVLVTLIDDAATIWHRIWIREQEELRGSYITLQEVFEWRRWEFLLSDRIAASVGAMSHLVPVKHPASMLYQAIYEWDECLPLYAAFPITAPRRGAGLARGQRAADLRTAGQVEVDEHRDRLRDMACTVWDPLTVDDRAIRSAFVREFKEEAVSSPPALAGKWVTIQPEDRWPAGSAKHPEMVPDPKDLFPLRLPAEEVFPVVYGRTTPAPPVLSVIDGQIRKRDYTYIEKCGTIAAYRPHWGGEESGGVCAEIRHASGVADVLVYHPQEDHTPGVSPFTELADVFVTDSREVFYEAIQKRQERRRGQERKEAPR